MSPRAADGPRYANLDIIQSTGVRGRPWRRWKIIGYEKPDYLVQPLFSDGGPPTAWWDSTLCENSTRLVRHSEPPGSICFTGTTHWYEEPCACPELPDAEQGSGTEKGPRN